MLKVSIEFSESVRISSRNMFKIDTKVPNFHEIIRGILSNLGAFSYISLI